MKLQSRVCALAMVTVLSLGCGGADKAIDESAVAAPPAGHAVATAATPLDPDDPTLIMRPFTAEEIRDEWVPGLRILVRRTYPEESWIERWTVLAADDEGAEIEYATIAADGSVVGEPTVARPSWVELRDHAAFPGENATREWVARDTALGTYEGWLYRVSKDGAATVQEFFFVPELPGAPVEMRVREGETTVFLLEQTARLRPESQ